MDEAIETIHKRELNENNAPLSLQMMSPGMTAYIQAPGVGHYLQSDIVNSIVLNEKRALSGYAVLCIAL